MSTHPDREFTPAQLAAQDDVRAGRMDWQKKQALQLKAVRTFIASHTGATAEEIEKTVGVEPRLFSILQKSGIISISGGRYFVRIAGETKEQKRERLKFIQKTTAKLKTESSIPPPVEPQFDPGRILVALERLKKRD
jgi:hypothetical protein